MSILQVLVESQRIQLQATVSRRGIRPILALTSSFVDLIRKPLKFLHKMTTEELHHTFCKSSVLLDLER
jgi:hypothetical protein